MIDGGGQREREWFHALTVPPGMWTVLRLDGRGFSRLTAAHFGKPFDKRFADLMVGTSRALFEEFGARFAYTVSDEMSLLLDPGFRLFGRNVEKLVSVSAGMASAGFALDAGIRGHFDSRIWMGGSIGEVGDYFAGRQADAARSALHGWCFWILRQDGRSRREAAEELAGKSTAEKNELLFRNGINFNDLPAWQRRGVGISRDESGQRRGLGISREESGQRHEVGVSHTGNGPLVEWELPMRAAFRELVMRTGGWRAETTIGP